MVRYTLGSNAFCYSSWLRRYITKQGRRQSLVDREINVLPHRSPLNPRNLDGSDSFFSQSSLGLRWGSVGGFGKPRLYIVTSITSILQIHSVGDEYDSCRDL